MGNLSFLHLLQRTMELEMKSSLPETSSIWSALLTCQQEGAMDIKAWEKSALIHFCCTSLKRHSTTPWGYKTWLACVKVSPKTLQRASTKPEGFHTPQETPWESNILRVNSSGLNHLYPSVCCWQSPPCALQFSVTVQSVLTVISLLLNVYCILSSQQ